MSSSSGVDKVKDKVNFSNNDDEELIEIVSSYEILYKFDPPDYKSNLKKDLVWNEIGVLLNKTGEQCKSRWRSIRDNFKRHKKTEVTRTGKPARKKRATYWDRLRFLDDVKEDRKELSNTDDQSTLSGGQDVFEENYHESLVEDTNDGILNEANLSTKSCADEQVQASNTCSDGSKIPKVGKKGNKNSTLIDLIKSRGEAQASLAQCIEKLVAPEVKEEDDIDYFLKSIGSTLKQFTAAEKIEAKRKIFNIVSELEERHHYRNRSLQTFDYVYSPCSSSVPSHTTTPSPTRPSIS